MSDPTHNEPTAHKSALNDAWLTALIWIAFMGAALFLRPLLPIDETRYVTVAWEMWLDGSFLVPHLNGELYTHKPPLLFWLINLGWQVFGVSDIWARLVAPLFGLGALWLTVRLAREMWPDLNDADFRRRAFIAPLMMVSGLYWAVFSTMTMFDMMLTAATLLSILGTVIAWKGFVSGRSFWGPFMLVGLGLGLGGLAKGPVILVHTLPVLLSAPLWGPKMIYGRGESGWGKWYAGIGVAIVTGLGVAAMWVAPAVIVGGPEYRDAILIKQSAGRVAQSFAHRRPVYWFLWVLPLMLLPWTLWPRLWKGFGFVKAWKANTGLRPLLALGNMRLLLIWAGADLVIFSAVSGKQPHYLLPMFPALALVVAYMLTTSIPGQGAAHDHPARRGHRVPVLFLGFVAAVLCLGLVAQDAIEPLLKKPLPAWADAAQPLWLLPAIIVAFAIAFTRARDALGEVRLIAMTVLSVVVLLHMAAAPALKAAYDLSEAGRTVNTFQSTLGKPVAYVGKYHGEFHFLGRLESPLVVFNAPDEARAWAIEHPEGVIVETLRESRLGERLGKPIYLQPYRGKVLGMWKASDY